MYFRGFARVGVDREAEAKGEPQFKVVEEPFETDEETDPTDLTAIEEFQMRFSGKVACCYTQATPISPQRSVLNARTCSCGYLGQITYRIRSSTISHIVDRRAFLK